MDALGDASGNMTGTLSRGASTQCTGTQVIQESRTDELCSLGILAPYESHLSQTI